MLLTPFAADGIMHRPRSIPETHLPEQLVRVSCQALRQTALGRCVAGKAGC